MIKKKSAAWSSRRLASCPIVARDNKRHDWKDVFYRTSAIYNDGWGTFDPVSPVEQSAFRKENHIYKSFQSCPAPLNRQ